VKVIFKVDPQRSAVRSIVWLGARGEFPYRVGFFFAFSTVPDRRGNRIRLAAVERPTGMNEIWQFLHRFPLLLARIDIRVSRRCKTSPCDKRNMVDAANVLTIEPDGRQILVARILDSVNGRRRDGLASPGQSQYQRSEEGTHST
jgi:hypothetical protein